MFILQIQYDGDSESANAHFGIRNRKRGAIAENASQDSLSVLADNMSADLLAPKRVMREREVADFMATLTPGAQNAIKAASFAWGYENASKYLKNAMKLDEVKNAGNPVEKSKAVIESMSTQSGQTEKSAEVSNFVWSYYNEDLKDVQAQGGKSETITEKSKAGVAEKEQETEQERMRLSMPAASQDAVAASICTGTLTPSLLYCAGAYREAEVSQEQRAVEEKRAELAKLMSLQDNRGAHAVALNAEGAHGKAAKNEEAAQRELLDSAAKLALERREEEKEAFEKTEKTIGAAMETLEKFAGNERDAAKKISAMLPSELSRYILSHEKKLSKKRALRSQLSAWAAFCRAGRKELTALPSSKLIKLASLSSFLKLGR